MAYTKKTWVSGETPLSAENMNNIENGIANAHEDISELNTKIKYKYQSVQKSGSQIGTVQKFGYIVELTINNLEVPAGTASSGIIFDVPEGYYPINRCDFQDTYAGIRFFVNTDGTVVITSAVSSTTLLRGTFTYISTS